MLISRLHAEKTNSNPVSHNNVGASAGVYLGDRQPRLALVSAGGHNTELHPYPIGVHAETAALVGLEEKLSPLFPTGLSYKTDLLAVTASPCGSCREEILKSGSPNTLVVMVDADGNAAIRKISGLFPVQFEKIRAQVPEIIENMLHWTSPDNSIPSRFEDGSLPAYAVSILLSKNCLFSGYGTGDDALQSATPTIMAIAEVKRYARKLARSNTPRSSAKRLDRSTLELAENKVFSSTQAILYVYERFPENAGYYVSGIDRQQLSPLPEETPVFIYNLQTQELFGTTRGELLPAALTRENSASNS